MKLITRLFLWITIVLCTSLAFIGSLLITSSFSYSMERENKQAVNQYQFIKYVLQSHMIANGTSSTLKDGVLTEIFQSGVNLEHTYISIADQTNVIDSTFPEDYENPDVGDLKSNQLIRNVKQYQDKYIVEVSGRIEENDEILYLTCAVDITSIMDARSHMEKVYFSTYYLVCLIGGIVVFILSAIILKPIRRLTKSAQIISQGHFNERVQINTIDEIGELSISFNKMAEEIEKKVDELNKTVVQKENFVASFAHELKTPLTSVVGYSDMIYSRDLGREKTKEAAEYIMNEGLRLEALSLKLMDLFVLDKQEFTLEYLYTSDLFKNIEETTTHLFKSRNASLLLEIEPAYVKVEYDLLKTLVLNILDNAVKAKATNIGIVGRHKGKVYQVCVKDNGFGIPKEELERITEAFYVVDKSRSRKYHGVGLGLALCERIAQIHDTHLEIQSEVGVGTEVSFSLEVCEEEI